MKPSSDPSQARGGFARIDLLAVLVAVGLLAALAQPVWGNPNATKSLVCMDNVRRLQAAWTRYAEDHGGTLVGNYHGGFVPPANATERPWATGWLDWTIRMDNTNTIYLSDPRYAALAPYLDRDSTVFKCPADGYLSPGQIARGWAGRVRSYAMNCFMGEGNVANGPAAVGYVQHKRLSDFASLSPQQVFVFLEEHPDSINDPLFFLPDSDRNWVDLPGSFHDGACWFTFADGHVEQRQWLSPQTVRPVTAGTFLNNTPAPPGDPDLLWVREHSTKQ